MIEAIGGRKVLIAIIVTIIGITAVLLMGDVPANFTHLLEVVFGAFVAGNMFEHYKDMRIETAPDTAAAPDLEPMSTHIKDTNDRLQATQDAVAQCVEGVGTVQQTLVHIIQKTGLDRK